MAENQNRNVANVAKSPELYQLKKNFASWLKQFRNYAELLNINANNVYRTFLSFMDDEAFTIVESLNLTNAQKNDFFDNATQTLVRTAIKNRQGVRIPAEYMLRFRKQHEGESVEQYASELEKMALEAFPEEQNIRENRQLIQSFLMGVRNDELGVKLLEENFDNLTNAVEAAARHCKALQTRRYIRKESEAQVLEKVYQVSCANCNCTNNKSSDPGTVNAVMTAGRNRNQQFHPPVMQQMKNTDDQTPYGQQLPTNSRAQQGEMQPYFQTSDRQHRRQYTDKRNIQCYQCRKYGHYRSECWDLMKYQSQPQQRPYCTYCGKSGHTEAKCWNLNRPSPDQNRTQTNQSYVQNQTAQNPQAPTTNPFRSN